MPGRRANVRCDVVRPVMTLSKSRYLKARMVYVLRADRPVKYQKDRSRIVYIGETGKGPKRPAGSMARMAKEAFNKLHGVRQIDVHAVTCRGRQHVRTWELLERAFLAVFKDIYGEVPRYNLQGKGKRFVLDDISDFNPKRVKNILSRLG